MPIRKLISDGIKITDIDEQIHIIHGLNRSRSPFSNSFLITDRINLILDAGCGISIIETILKSIKVDLAVLSHSHPDHTSGSWLLNSAGTCILVPSENADSIGNADKLATRMVGSDLSETWKSEYLPATGYRDFAYTETFTGGHEFSTGQINLTAIPAPGHTNDHYCLWEPDRKLIFGFDIDLSPFGPWYGNPESDIGLFIKSIAEIKALPFETYISSHAKPANRAHALRRLETYGSVIESRDRLIFDLMPQGIPVSTSDMTWISPIYGCDYKSKMDKILFYGESNMVSKHLARLADMGGIILQDDAFMKKA
jgi:glyoxylase-like metal-dependent hydrolase (beta-lactamase superfamily II)